MSLSFQQILQNTEATATKLGMDIEQALLFVSHLIVTSAPALTTAATVAETISGNAELVPLTNAVSGVVQTTAGAVIANQNPVAQISAVGAAIVTPIAKS